jgi:heptosyltransferase-3
MSRNDAPEPDRVLIYRLGSIGDTAVALPCFKFLRKRFAKARLSLLTNHPRQGEAPVMSVIGPMDLVDGVIPYNVGERDPRKLLSLSRRIRAERPDLLIYLSAYRGTLNLARDILFFRASGIRRVLGAPFSADLRAPRPIGSDGMVEGEAARLARNLATLGQVDVQSPYARNLCFTDKERRFAGEKITPPFGGRRFIAAAVGAKIPSKDWGENAWEVALSTLAASLPDIGLVMIGGLDDQPRSERLARVWRGPTLDLCGKATPRESAAVMAEAETFLGTDGGPMHLAAASNTRCCVVFGPYNQPGHWYPLGGPHHIVRVPALEDADPKDFAGAVLSLMDRTPS